MGCLGNPRGAVGVGGDIPLHVWTTMEPQEIQGI